MSAIPALRVWVLNRLHLVKISGLDIRIVSSEANRPTTSISVADGS